MQLKCTYLIIFLLGLGSTVFAQPVITSQSVTGGNAKDSLTIYFLTSDGGAIAGGSSNSGLSGDKTQNSKGGRDYWVVKYGNTGSIQWQRTLGGNAADILMSMQQTTDGGYILAGFSDSKISGDKTEAGWSKYDYWLVKLDASGATQWDKTIGGDGDDGMIVIKQTSDGGYIMGGSSNSPISGLKTENNWDFSYDHWVVKTNSTGTVEWDITVGGDAFERINTIDENPDGSFILGGFSESNISGQKTEDKRGIFDYWLVKIDHLGNFIWDKTIGGNKRDMLNSMRLTKDGGYILSGSSESKVSGEKTEPNRGASSTVDYWVVKLDSARNIEWQKTIGGTLNDSCNSVVQTKDGGYILGGYSQSNISGEKTENSKGATDYWVVKLTKTGAIQWQKTIGGSAADNLINIIETKKNFYVLAGYSASDISGDKTSPSKGDIDYWIVKLRYTNPAVNAGLNTADALSSNRDFSAGPNPANNELFVQSKVKTSFSFLNQAGNVLVTKTIEGNGVIDITKLAAGLYYLKNNSTGEVKKIMVD